MAARRTQVGLRRRGPGLSARPAPAATRRGWSLTRPLLALVLAGLPACLGLSEQETRVLEVHTQNSQMFYQQGSYMQSLQQANQALTLDQDHMGMRVIRGFCLTKIGAAREAEEQLDQSLEVFEQLKDDDVVDYRAWLGSGEAHLARAMQHERVIKRIDRRLASDFLTPEARTSELAQREREAAAAKQHLEVAEADLRHVLAMPLHQDETYAMMELVVVLDRQGGRDDETGALARRAVDQIVQSIDLTRERLNKTLQIVPSKKLEMQRRIEDQLDKERQLRDIIIGIELDRGSTQRALAELSAIEERQLMRPGHHATRAELYEQLGMWTEALAEWETFLRLRAGQHGYDDVAAESYDRIESLQARIASQR